MMAKWIRKLVAVIYLLNLGPLGLPHILKCSLWGMAKSTCKSQFHIYTIFSTAQLYIMPNVNFALSSINKDQFELFKLEIIAAINTLDGYVLGDNLSTSHQVD